MHVRRRLNRARSARFCVFPFYVFRLDVLPCGGFFLSCVVVFLLRRATGPHFVCFRPSAPRVWGSYAAARSGAPVRRACARAWASARPFRASCASLRRGEWCPSEGEASTGIPPSSRIGLCGRKKTLPACNTPALAQVNHKVITRSPSDGPMACRHIT